MATGAQQAAPYIWNDAHRQECLCHKGNRLDPLINRDAGAVAHVGYHVIGVGLTADYDEDRAQQAAPLQME
jgi:hypothetical protein